MEPFSFELRIPNRFQEPMMKVATLRHQQDPAVADHSRWHCWHYCYLHGDAERLNESTAREEQFADEDNLTAADLFVADAPMPEADGIYLVEVYGKMALAVISQRWFKARGGRVALAADPEGLKHALTPEDWR